MERNIDFAGIDFTENKFEFIALLEKIKKGEAVQEESYDITYTKFIDKVLLNIPSTLVIDMRDEARWVISDSQIFNLLVKYMNNQIKFTSKYYEINESHFKDIERRFQRRIEDYKFNAIILRPNSSNDFAEDFLEFVNCN